MLKETPRALSNDNKSVICVVGPTASGKSELAQSLAEILDGEIVSADSMQVYKGMDIGTAKVPFDERTVPYHCIDLVDPNSPYSAALYQRDSRAAFTEIFARGKTPVLVGGTGFYVRAAIDAYDFPKGEQTNNPVRDIYNDFLHEHGASALWEELERLDADSAHVIHPNNSKRVIRALELHSEGKSYVVQLERLKSIPEAIPAKIIGISVERDELAKRINRRVDSMRDAGLLFEVEGLLEQGFREGITCAQAIGYKELVSALDGEISIDEAFEQIKTSTRRYAKRQRSWFGRDDRIEWIDGNESNQSALIENAIKLIQNINDETCL